MGKALRKAGDPHIALVIEDQPDVRDLAAAILEETDHKVAAAANAEEALAFLNDHGSEVAMMFVDVKLPGGDAAQVDAESWPWIRCVVGTWCENTSVTACGEARPPSSSAATPPSAAAVRARLKRRRATRGNSGCTYVRWRRGTGGCGRVQALSRGGGA